VTASTSKDAYRTLTVAAVMTVAAIAAVVSFVHIESLAVRYGQPALAAYLLPVSIDGTVAVSSLAMLRSARAGLSSPWLARSGLVLSVGATVACNVGYGLAHGLPGALLSGWPAIAFILSAETAISMSRRSVSAAQSQPGRPAVSEPDRPAQPAARRKSPARRGRSPAVTEAQAVAILAGQPDITGGALARELGVSPRTGQRLRDRLTRSSAAT